jgi:hypothetical protein
MKARKVAILLTLTALTALTLFIVTLMDSPAHGMDVNSDRAGAVPDTIEYYRESVSIGPDGDAFVEVSAVLANGGFGDLLLPFAFEDGNDFTILSGPVLFNQDDQGRSLPTREVLGYRMLNLELVGPVTTGDTLRVRGTVPGWFDRKEARQEYGEFSLRRGFINSSVFVLRRLELAVELPEGMLVHSVTRVSPSYDPKKSPEPPYAIGRSGDVGWAVLKQEMLKPAGSVRLDLHVRPARRGPIPLVAGLVAVVLYLAFFRDVLKPKETE